MLPDTHALGLDPGRLGTALTAACRAPSLHNSQPWRFRVGPDVIELWADPERVLPAADPEGREQRMACGAALLTLRLALRGFGVRPTVTVLPDRARPDLIAEVRRGGERPAGSTPGRVRSAGCRPKLLGPNGLRAHARRRFGPRSRQPGAGKTRRFRGGLSDRIRPAGCAGAYRLDSRGT